MSTNAIEVFTFPFTNQNVRIIDQNGDPWFIAKDVCDILGFDHAPSAVRALDEDERNTVRISHGNRGNPNATIINE
jgi:prophage antirepressor-like protein